MIDAEKSAWLTGQIAAVRGLDSPQPASTVKPAVQRSLF
jgi:hypothetical protein